MSENKKSSYLYILKILEEFSDENHPLTHKEIIDLVYQEYGLELERKSVASSLKILEDSGYDINKGNRNGFYLLERNFNESEVSFLVDAIFSSREISGKQARELSKKVYSCLSKYKRRDYEYLFKSDEINRTDNKNIFFNIEIINEAIKRKKVVKFKYKDFDENGNETLRYNGFKFHVCPYYVVNNYGKYYLLARRRKYDVLSVFRLDYIRDPEIMEDGEFLDIKDITQYKNGFDIAEYLNSHVYLFGGEVCNAKLELKNTAAISYVKDWFGNNASIKKENNKLIARIKCNENALFYWAIQYSQSVKVIYPDYLVDRIKKALDEIVKDYK
mgnify:CR=1 FL=1